MKAGDYQMLRGSLVRLSEEPRPGNFGVQYVQIVDGGVTSGGASFYWGAEEFMPVTDGRLLAAAKLFEAMRIEQAAQGALTEARHRRAVAQGVWETMRDAAQAGGA